MISKHKIQELITLVENSGVSEVEMSSFWGFTKLKISKNQSTHLPAQMVSHTIANTPVQSGPPATNLQTEVPKPSDNQLEIKAPLVGTYYSAAKPGDAPYLKTGDVVSVGQVVCIIEAMKIFNEIESEITGRVTEVLIQNEQPVEFDQPLFIIEPL